MALCEPWGQIFKPFKFLRKTMDNQHTYIDGYRDLSREEIDTMNDIKRMGNSLGNYLEALGSRDDMAVDQRWLSIAKTEIQKGLMAAVRSVAKPTSF